MKTIEQLIKELNFFDLIGKLKTLFQRIEALVQGFVSTEQLDEAIETATENYVQKTGDIMTGDLEFSNGLGIKASTFGADARIYFEDGGSITEVVDDSFTTSFTINNGGLFITADNPASKGVTSPVLYNKADDPLAYPQIDDVVLRKGTLAGSPITGNLQYSGSDTTGVNSFGFFSSLNGGDIKSGFDIQDDGGLTPYIYYINELDRSDFSIDIGQAYISSTNENFKGIVGNTLYNKQNDPNAHAQIGDVQNATGFASYTDTAYTAGAPFTALAGVTVALPNNAGIIYDDEKPSDISSFYTAGKITGRDGDGLGIMIYFNATPSIINSELDIWIDIGGAVGVIYKQTIYFRGTTEKGVLYSLPVAYSRATWEANGGTVYIKPSVDMTMYGMNFNIARTSKSNNQ